MARTCSAVARLRAPWLLLLCVLGAPVSVAAAPGDDIAATVEITASGRSLQARYTLPRETQRLPLKRVYSTELRQRVWRIQTPGVRLDGSALVGDEPFKTVDIRAEALPAPVPKDYAPLASFSDGGVAVFTGLFDAGSESQRTRFRFMPAAGERIVLFGRAHERAAEWVSDSDSDGTYAYFGTSALVRSGAGLAVLDRRLPAWVRAQVDSLFPQLIAFYRQRFGRAAPFTPFVLFSFGDSDVAGTHSQGSVLPGLLYMRLDGSAWLEPDDESRRGLRWTLAHEAAHFWNLANLDPAGAQWMHEGSADLFAYRALHAFGDLDGARLERAYEKARTACLNEVGDESVNEVERRNGRVAYSCGLVMALYTEEVLRQRDADTDLFAFWRALLDQAGGDGYTQASYVSTLVALSGDAMSATWLARFAERGLAPGDSVGAAFARVRGSPDHGVGEFRDTAPRRVTGRVVLP